jgi:very-long-chain (3R)-3-hydroxyacyl-CoA dehydratase
LTVGWAYVLWLAVERRDDYKKMYPAVRIPLQIFQTAAILEVLHAATGIVKSNVILTAFQVASRVFMVWGILEVSPPSTVSIGVPLLLFAWCVTEIIRYGYYFLNLVGLAQIIVWFRYTLFIALYPIGVSGELICLYNSLAHVRDKRIFYYSMPNKLNVAFDYQYALICIALSYVPIFPHLYLHMFAQRRKIIGGGSSAPKAKAQ